MPFNSFAFIGFFAAVALATYAVPQRWRWMLLLAASAYFYSAFQAKNLLLLAVSTIVAYGAGRAIASHEGRRRRLLLVTGVAIELSILVVYKYLDFLTASLEGAIAALDAYTEPIALPRLGLLLPAGLSFYTFSAISYMIDVFRGTTAPEHHLGRLALYVSFFPKLLAGPIERAGPFLEQLIRPIRFERSLVVAGLQLMLLGLIKKVVIADRLADFVNAGFTNPALQSPVTVLIAVYFYAFQIYCDFSGYSDIAIGASAVLGIRLMENFRRPYFSQSVAEFWGGRWHISLMLWFRDYLYIPLGGNRVSRPRLYLNQLIVFLVSGLWHGANWTFLIWGGLNGVYQVLYMMTHGGRAAARRVLPQRLWAALSMLLTFHLILVSWIFFRAETVGRAWAIIERIITSMPQYPALIASYNWTNEFWLAAGLIGGLLVFEACEEIGSAWTWLARQHTAVRWAAYYAGAALLLVIGKWGGSQFVYMQF